VEHVGLDGGELVLTTADVEVRHRRPVVFAEREGRRWLVDGRFVLRGTGEVGFDVDPVPPGTRLVIDPVLVFSTYLSGVGNDWGRDVTVLSDGGVIAVGYTDSLDFASKGGAQPGNNGAFDTWVARFDRQGQLVYATYLGGTWRLHATTGVACVPNVPVPPLSDCFTDDFGFAVAADDAGHAYVAGWTRAQYFPTRNAAQPESPGGANGFVAKLSPMGDELLYSTYVGGSGSDELRDIAVGPDGSAAVIGFSDSEDFPSASPAQPSNGGTFDTTITVIAPSGRSFRTSTVIGGSGEDLGMGVAFSPSGSLFVTGFTESPDFPTVEPVHERWSGDFDGFVAEWPADGGPLVFSTFLGGAAREKAQDLAVDEEGAVYVTGWTVSDDFPLAEPTQDVRAGDSDAFLARLDRPLDEDGNLEPWRLAFSTYLGGALPDSGEAVTADADGLVTVSGFTPSADFPLHRSMQGPNPGGTKISNDAFVLRVDPKTWELRYSTLLGGATSDGSFGHSVGRDGSVAVVGFTSSSNFPVASAHQEQPRGTAVDAFLSLLAD
jgi:hypothetical protein